MNIRTGQELAHGRGLALAPEKRRELGGQVVRRRRERSPLGKVSRQADQTLAGRISLGLLTTGLGATRHSLGGSAGRPFSPETGQVAVELAALAWGGNAE